MQTQDESVLSPRLFLVRFYSEEPHQEQTPGVLLLQRPKMSKCEIPNQNMQVPFLNNYDPMYFNPRAYVSLF